MPNTKDTRRKREIVKQLSDTSFNKEFQKLLIFLWPDSKSVTGNQIPISFKFATPELNLDKIPLGRACKAKCH